VILPSTILFNLGESTHRERSEIRPFELHVLTQYSTFCFNEASSSSGETDA